MCEPVHLERQRHVADHRAQQGDGLCDKQQAIVAMPKRREIHGDAHSTEHGVALRRARVHNFLPDAVGRLPDRSYGCGDAACMPGTKEPTTCS